MADVVVGTSLAEYMLKRGHTMEPDTAPLMSAVEYANSTRVYTAAAVNKSTTEQPVKRKKKSKSDFEACTAAPIMSTVEEFVKIKKKSTPAVVMLDSALFEDLVSETAPPTAAAVPLVVTAVATLVTAVDEPVKKKKKSKVAAVVDDEAVPVPETAPPLVTAVATPAVDEPVPAIEEPVKKKKKSKVAAAVDDEAVPVPETAPPLVSAVATPGVPAVDEPVPAIEEPVKKKKKSKAAAVVDDGAVPVPQTAPPLVTALDAPRVTAVDEPVKKKKKSKAAAAVDDEAVPVPAETAQHVTAAVDEPVTAVNEPVKKKKKSKAAAAVDDEAVPVHEIAPHVTAAVDEPVPGMDEPVKKKKKSKVAAAVDDEAVPVPAETAHVATASATTINESPTTTAPAQQQQLVPIPAQPVQLTPALTLRDTPPTSLLTVAAGMTMSNFFMPVPIAHPQKDKREFTTIARYGRTYKRKRHSATIGYMAHRCPVGFRYCTHCKKPMPLESFYTQNKRYICRKHHYEMVKSRLIIRMSEDEVAFSAEKAWINIQVFWPLIGLNRLNYDAHDFKDLIKTLDIPLAMEPHFVPIDPTRPLRPRNVAIITKKQLHILMRISQNTGSRAQHILFVQTCNLVPLNADVGIPWNPYHDADYKRVDIDLVPIIEEERNTDIMCPSKDWMQELKQEAKSKPKRPLADIVMEGFPDNLIQDIVEVDK